MPHSFPYSHFNDKSKLPPVDCPLLIIVNESVIKARRTTFIESKNHQMEYLLESGETIQGRFNWTYP